jgi:hypothetical protein
MNPEIQRLMREHDALADHDRINRSLLEREILFLMESVKLDEAEDPDA